jgi:hypothetical protein
VPFVAFLAVSQQVEAFMHCDILAVQLAEHFSLSLSWQV